MSEYTYEYNGQCYKNCSYYHYYNNNNTYCTVNFSCPKEYPILLEDKFECIKDKAININEIEDTIKKNQINETNKTEEEIIKYYDNILETVEASFTLNNYDTSNIDNGKDEIIETKKMKIILTTIENQSNKKNDNITTIELGECENAIKKYYNMTNNQTIYMKYIQVYQEGLNIPKIEYDIYSKLFENNITKLNLTICEDKKLYISIPLIITENIDKLNSKSDYYNNICYTTTSDSGTDITLKDRKNDYIKNNKTLCQDDCDLSSYDYDKQKVNCSCNIKLIIFHIISIFIFYLSQLNVLDKIINNISFGIKNFDLIKSEEEKLNTKKTIKKEIKKSLFNYFNKKETTNINSNEIILPFQKNIKSRCVRKTDNKQKIKTSKSMGVKDNNNIINKKKEKKLKQSNNNKIIMNHKDKLILAKQKKLKERVKKIMEYNDEEKNNLSYNIAIKYDKRNYCQYYISLLRTKHNFIFSFIYNNDYNSKIIKINLYLISFSIYYTVNALFFDDETMHKIYLDKGSLNIEYQLPKIIYSSIISIILNALLKLLALSSDKIIEFKKDKTKDNIHVREI